jgi:hypothetical protein
VSPVRPEPGQSQASADALEDLTRQWAVVSDAKIEVRRLGRELYAARKRLAAAEAEESRLDKAYIDTPYAAVEQ